MFFTIQPLQFNSSVECLANLWRDVSSSHLAALLIVTLMPSLSIRAQDWLEIAFVVFPATTIEQSSQLYSCEGRNPHWSWLDP